MVQKENYHEYTEAQSKQMKDKQTTDRPFNTQPGGDDSLNSVPKLPEKFLTEELSYASSEDGHEEGEEESCSEETIVEEQVIAVAMEDIDASEMGIRTSEKKQI